MKYFNVLLLSLVTVSCVDLPNGNDAEPIVDLGGVLHLKTHELQYIVYQSVKDGVILMVRKGYFSILVEEQEERLQNMIASFRTLVEKIKDKKSSCLDSYILNLYDTTTTDVSLFGITDCFKNHSPPKYLLPAILQQTHKLWNQLKRVDDEIVGTKDQGQKYVTIARAYSVTFSNFTDFYFQAYDQLVDELAKLEACIDEEMRQLIAQVVSSVISLNDCYHSN